MPGFLTRCGVMAAGALKMTHYGRRKGYLLLGRAYDGSLAAEPEAGRTEGRDGVVSLAHLLLFFCCGYQCFVVLLGLYQCFVVLLGLVLLIFGIVDVCGHLFLWIFLLCYRRHSVFFPLNYSSYGLSVYLTVYPVSLDFYPFVP